MRNFSLPAKAFTLGIGALASICGIGNSGAAPTIPGLHAKHPLGEAQIGRLLIEELRCAACHEGIAPGSAPTAPDLGGVGTRLNPDFLGDFIANPAAHDPGTAMPDVLGKRTEAERSELAASLSAYLISLGTEGPHPPLAEDDAKSGGELFHKVGCVACHAPRDESGAELSLPGDVGLGHVGLKYQPGGLVGFLHEPLKARPAGRMPDMGLSRSEAELISAFLLGDGVGEKAPAGAEATAERIAAGKKAFTGLGCVACHQVEDAALAPLPAPSRAELDLSEGCLSETPGAAPDYSLGDDQRAAIRAALEAKPAKPEPAEAVKARLTQLNCISCHERDDYGGVPEELDSYFHSTEEALGNESRIPPQLTLAGAKLRPEWMNKVLYDGEGVRPYMTTRMPRFGPEALEGLTGLFGETDKMEPFEFAALDKESEPMMRNGAHLLLGDKGLNCIACHNYNGKESPGMKGLDLMTSYQRLQPAWFNQFMRNPASLRPGIIMPSFWPDGKAVQTEILDGDTEEQIRALWHNFSLGRSARDPSGLRVEDPELVVSEKAITYRGRSQVAGYRGIAVGLPGGLNYAFNAETGALSSIWSGRFVKVGWTGQGSGNFTPADRAIQLAQDVAFLPTAADPWPLHPQRTKENPVNPDPLYPRQHGYAFKGYSIGDDGVPTFRYHSGTVAIEDSSVALAESAPAVLRRTLVFDAREATTLFFRALAGKVEKVSETSFENGDVRLTLGEGAAITSHTLRETAGGELLFRLDLPAGTSTQTIDYVPLR